MRLLRPLKTELVVLATVLLGGGLMGWVSSRLSADGSSGYELISADELEPFRSAFNASSDHIRAVLLVGPT